ncbi:MAG: hydrolase [Cyclobacteriaceae bacterium]|nr:MAG: hydrolase [Cyclobacteriaceae bacterium]
MAVLFDMDGVIAHTNPFHHEAIRRFCEKYGFHLSEEEMKQRIYGRTNKDWITALFGSMHAEDLQRLAEEKEALFRDLYRAQVQPVRGLLQFMQELARHRIICALTTSAPPANVDFLMAHIPVKPYFSITLDERAVTHGKPHPEIYLKAAKALQLPNRRCVVIEDSLSGIAAARAAGSPVVGITTTHTAHELAHADYIIRDFYDLSVDDLQRLVA